MIPKKQSNEPIKVTSFKIWWIHTLFQCMGWWQEGSWQTKLQLVGGGQVSAHQCVFAALNLIGFEIGFRVYGFEIRDWTLLGLFYQCCVCSLFFQRKNWWVGEGQEVYIYRPFTDSCFQTSKYQFWPFTSVLKNWKTSSYLSTNGFQISELVLTLDWCQKISTSVTLDNPQM